MPQLETGVKKVLFLNPPDPSIFNDNEDSTYSYFEHPLGLMYVYSHIKERGDIDVKFVDLNIEMKFVSTDSLDTILHDVLDEFQPDLVAVAALYYNSIDIFHNIAKIIKEHRPGTTVAFGGHYPTHMTNDAMCDANVDYAILSEGEVGLSNLIDSLNGTMDITDVDGISYKDASGKIIRNPRKKFMTEVCPEGRLPWEDTKFEYYFREGRNVLHRVLDRDSMRIAAVTATRGCPHACTFCSSPQFWSRRWRKRKVSDVIDEIKYLIENFGVNTIVFNDENISVNKKWFIELLDGLMTLDIRWMTGGGLSVRTLQDKEVVDKMVASGIVLFNLAIESSSDEMLKKVKKPSSILEIETVIQHIRSHENTYIIGFFIVGFPDDTGAQIQTTFDYAHELDIDWKCFYCFQPFPGTELYDYCLDTDLIEKFDKDYGEVYYASQVQYKDFTPEELSKLNYYHNLKTNFVNNRNLLAATPDSLAQAERDFQYVLDAFPDHVFALRGIAKIRELQGDLAGRDDRLSHAESLLATSDFDWSYYLDELEAMSSGS